MDLAELKERQSWTLSQKIDHSLGVIDQFISRLDGKVYVSFSGGKDSTVLLDLCRIVKPDIKAVFCNTGNEYPDIVYFVRELQRTEGYNIEIIRPKLRPQEVLEKYGFPLVSKDISSSIYQVESSEKESVIQRRIYGRKKNGEKMKGNVGTISKRWLWLLREGFKTSAQCCMELKKKPFHKYEKDNGLYPILGIMASESRMRELEYIVQGQCNTFGGGNGKIKSMPLSIWLEDDVWAYIKDRNLKIAEIYHKGATRTGCMFCGYGCQFAHDNRLELCYNLYPKAYQLFMNYTNNGVTYREALRKVLAHSGLSLPDENKQLTLF